MSRWSGRFLCTSIVRLYGWFGLFASVGKEILLLLRLDFDESKVELAGFGDWTRLQQSFSGRQSVHWRHLDRLLGTPLCSLFGMSIMRIPRLRIPTE